MTDDPQSYSIAAIRELLLAAFSPEELRRFCQDRPPFRAIVYRFGPGHGLDDMVDEVIDYCRTRLLWDELLAEVKDENPQQYARLASELDGPRVHERGSPPDSRDLRPVTRPVVDAPTGPIRNRWALLVGINRYVDRAIPDLRFCVNDVVALDKLLKTQGFSTVVLHDNLTQEDRHPTRDNIEAELARLCQVAGHDDLLWVHLACHGKLVNGEPVLITRETRTPTLAERALPLSEVERRMRHSQARRLVLTLDACHTGVEIGRDLGDPVFIRNAYELAEGFALLAASTAQQVAQEWQNKEHGVFTYFLLDGLSGQADREAKGFVTVDDIHLYVLDGLRRWNVEHGGLIQEPTARTEGLGSIVLAELPAVQQPAPAQVRPARLPVELQAIKGQMSQAKLVEIEQQYFWRKWSDHRDETGFEMLRAYPASGEPLAPSVQLLVHEELAKLRQRVPPDGTMSPDDEVLEKRLLLLLSETDG